MSKKLRVIELVHELLDLASQMERKEAELDDLLDGAELSVGYPVLEPKPSGPKSATPGDSSRDRILKSIRLNRGRSMTTADVCKAAGCPTHVFVYHIKFLIEEGLVKRVKHGHYQLRDRKS